MLNLSQSLSAEYAELVTMFPGKLILRLFFNDGISFSPFCKTRKLDFSFLFSVVAGDEFTNTLSKCPGDHPILYRGLKLSSKNSTRKYISKIKVTVAS